MELARQYSLPQLWAIWNEHQNHREGFGTSNEDKILGVTVAAFVTLLIFYSILWIIALVLIILNAHLMPSWGIALAIVGLFLPGLGPIFTIIIALVVRK